MPRPLTRKEIIAQCEADPFVFFKLLRIYSKPKRKHVQFNPKPEQQRLLRSMIANNRIVVVKARQIGVSTVVAAYYFWLMYFSKDATLHGIVSHKDRSSTHLLEMVRSMHNSLPQWMKRPLYKDNKHEFIFASANGTSGAGIQCYSAQGRGGATRSFTFTSCHISEFAFWDDQEAILADIVATVGEGPIIIETTVEGPGDHYHNLVLEANDEDSEWTVYFSPWFKDIQYQKKSPLSFTETAEEKRLARIYGLTLKQLWWRRVHLKTMKSKFYREYPSSVDEAFEIDIAKWFPRGFFYDIEIVKGQLSNGFYYNNVIDEDDEYVMAADVAGGVGSDYSTITVLSRTSRDPVYHYQNNEILPEDFADIIASVYHRFYHAYTLVESNNHGHLVLYKLKESGCRNIYKKDGKDWVTSKQSKLRAYEILRSELASSPPKQLESHVHSELLSLIYESDKAPNAPQGLHDDLAVSMALAYVALDSKPQYIHPKSYSAYWSRHIRSINQRELRKNPGGLKRNRRR